MDKKNRRGLLSVCFTIAFLGHFLFILLAVLTFDDKQNYIGGLSGDIDKKIGSSNVNVVPIKLDTKVGDTVEALEIIAQRVQSAHQAQEAEEKAQKEQEEALNELERRKQQEEEKAKEQERVKQAALEKARVIAEEKAKKEQEEKRKIEERRRLEETKIKSKKNKATGTQDRSSSSSQNSAQNANNQSRREKSTTANRQEAANQSGSFNDIFGNGGGDGAKINDYSAADIERYRQRVQSMIYRNFSVSSKFANRGCRVSVEILKDGTLRDIVILGGDGDDVCSAAQKAIIKTNKVEAPNPGFYDQVHFTTFYFIYRR